MQRYRWVNRPETVCGHKQSTRRTALARNRISTGVVIIQLIASRAAKSPAVCPRGSPVVYTGHGTACRVGDCAHHGTIGAEPGDAVFQDLFCSAGQGTTGSGDGPARGVELLIVGGGSRHVDVVVTGVKGKEGRSRLVVSVG